MINLSRDEDGDDDGDSDQTESYTPPPLDLTDQSNNSSEKENRHRRSSLLKEQSIIVLDDSFNQVNISRRADDESAENYWDQWPLVSNDLNNQELSKLYSIPDIDMPPSPPRPIAASPNPQPSTTTTTESRILDILTLPSSLLSTNRQARTPEPRKPPAKRKKKKKPMSDYRPPSPFSPKPDYKCMDIEQLKKHAMKYGLSTSQSKRRLVQILDEIYNVTHQYETDTDFEFEGSDVDLPKETSHKKDLLRTPPTPAMIPEKKKPKKRQAFHQMSSSDEVNEHSPPKVRKTSPISVPDNDQKTQSEEDEEDGGNHEGRFLELTVYELSSSTASSSSPSITATPPAPLLNISPSKQQSPMEIGSPSSTTKKSKAKPSASDSDVSSSKKLPKRPKLQTPTVPLKEIVRNYIEADPTLHARILCYEPIDFEEFHKQMKTDLNLKIQSKELMQCLDDQCITFTLRSRKGAFTSVMRAKRRHK